MLTSSDLLSLGIKPGEIFGQILKRVKECDSKEEAISLAKSIWEQSCTNKPKHDSIRMIPDSVWEWLCHNSCFKEMPSIETGNSFASNSEKRRWLEQGAVLINGIRPKPDDLCEGVFVLQICNLDDKVLLEWQDDGWVDPITLAKSALFVSKVEIKRVLCVKELVFFKGSSRQITML